MCKSNSIFSLSMSKILLSTYHEISLYLDSNLNKCFVSLLDSPIILHLGLFVINDNTLSKHRYILQLGKHSTLQLTDFLCNQLPFSFIYTL